MNPKSVVAAMNAACLAVMQQSTAQQLSALHNPTVQDQPN